MEEGDEQYYDEVIVTGDVSIGLQGTMECVSGHNTIDLLVCSILVMVKG